MKYINDRFVNYYNEKPFFFFVSPGRLEIIGNHTDHNGGYAITGPASINTKAAVSKNSENKICMFSEGHTYFEIPTTYIEPSKDLYGQTDSFVKGIVSGFLKRGYKIGGFKAYLTSDVKSGSGLSSSASFEILICTILNELFNDGKIEKMELVKIGQEAESLYYGKPCGLLDQIGCAFDGLTLCDFKDRKNPIAKSIPWNLNLKIIITDPGASHNGLDSYYASIPNAMFKGAKYFYKEILREVDFNDFSSNIENLKSIMNQEEFDKNIHFFNENIRVLKAFNANLNNNVEDFIKQINDSGLSSSNLLRNTFIEGRYEGSPEEALSLARQIAPLSAHRVHGGGFAGTIISFVRPNDVKKFIEKMREKYGEKNVYELEISPYGARRI